MVTKFQFYPFLSIIKTPNSKSERLLRSLITIESSIPPILLDQFLMCRGVTLTSDVVNEVMLHGIIAMSVDDKIVSCAFIAKNKIDRIITLPMYRRKGYASVLINHITDCMMEGGIPIIWSPVASHAVPLFEKLGWIRVGKGSKDGCVDYCPKEHVDVYRSYLTKGGYIEFDLGQWHRFIILATIFSKKR